MHVAILERSASRLPLSFSRRLIVVLNEKLLEVMGVDVTPEQAFTHANDLTQNAVGGAPYQACCDRTADVVRRWLLPGGLGVQMPRQFHRVV